MTVQEVINWLKVASAPFYNKDKRKEAIDMAIQALEEVEQYRALGTVEELKEARKFKKYFDDLYGEGLEVANWHQNGDLEPFDTFYESALNWEEGGTSD